MPHPGKIVTGNIILFDEPEHVNVTVFEATGETLLTFNARPGADFGQILIGLSAAQTVELVRRLLVHLDHCHHAVEIGRGGAQFTPASEDNTR